MNTTHTKPRKYKGDRYYKIGNLFYNIASFIDAIAAAFYAIGDRKNV